MAKSVYTRRYSAVGIMLAIAITVGAALSGGITSIALIALRFLMMQY